MKKLWPLCLMIFTALLCAACAQPPGYWCRSEIYNIRDKTRFIRPLPSEVAGVIGLCTGLYKDKQGKRWTEPTEFKLDKGKASRHMWGIAESGQNPVLILPGEHILLHDHIGERKEGRIELISYDFLKQSGKAIGRFTKPEPERYTLPIFMYTDNQVHLLYPLGDKLIGIALDGAPKQPTCELTNIAAQGYGFVDGQRRLVCVTTAGQAWRYDTTSRSFQRVAELDWLGRVLTLPAPKGKKPTRSFAFAQGLAGYVSKDAVILFDPQGRERSIPVRNVLEYNPNGTKRPDAIINAAINDPQPLVGERLVVGDKDVGYCFILPFDDTHVALFDVDYQRFLLFSVR